MLLACAQPSGTSKPSESMALTSTARIAVAASLVLSILTVHHESPNIGVLTQKGTTFQAWAATRPIWARRSAFSCALWCLRSAAAFLGSRRAATYSAISIPSVVAMAADAWTA
jgi:hypothetical protein